MSEERADIPDLVARALELPGLDRVAVANRLAEIAELPIPARSETVDYLVDTRLAAVAYIPSQPVAWSWGEFHNGARGRLTRWTDTASLPALDLQRDVPMTGRVVLEPHKAGAPRGPVASSPGHPSLQQAAAAARAA